MEADKGKKLKIHRSSITNAFSEIPQNLWAQHQMKVTCQCNDILRGFSYKELQFLEEFCNIKKATHSLVSFKKSLMKIFSSLATTFCTPS